MHYVNPESKNYVVDYLPCIPKSGGSIVPTSEVVSPAKIMHETSLSIQIII